MRITPASAKAVRHACLKFHYAKAVPSVQYGYNVYNDADEWCGVICYGSGATTRIAEPFDMNQGEVLELVRVALNGKQGHGNTSQAVSMTLRQLHKDAPLVRIVVSFADMDENHIGTIYQATNWIFLGRRNEGLLSAFIVNGKKTHRRSIGAKGVRQNIDAVRAKIDPNAEEFRTAGKRKYAYPMDRRARKLLESMSVPYEKRDK